MKIIPGIRKYGRREKDMNYQGISKVRDTFARFIFKNNTFSVYQAGYCAQYGHTGNVEGKL